MLEQLKALLRPKSRPLPPTPTTPDELTDQGASGPSTDVQQPKETAHQDLPGSGDVEAKIGSARCDIHPLYQLRAESIEVPPSAKKKVLHCTKAACNRHYLPQEGYFGFVGGEPPDFGKLETKPKCDLNHERRYMVVTKLNGQFLWACPEDGCLNAFPYVESSENGGQN